MDYTNSETDFNCTQITNPQRFDPNNNMFIEASAGTGKTYTIQQIVARLLLEKDMSIDRILIVTYTEKAAGELNKRIRDKMQEVCESGFLVDKKHIHVEDITPFKTALRDIDSAQIYTIHSFCQKILREHAYETGRPFDMKIVSDDEVEGLVDKWVRDKWPQDKNYQDLIAICDDKSLDNLIENFRSLLKNAIKQFYLTLDNKPSSDIIMSKECYVCFGQVLSETEINACAKANCFDDLVHYPYFSENLAVLNSNLGHPFDGKKRFSDFKQAMEAWNGENPTDLFNGSSFRANSVLTSASSDIQQMFEYFKQLKEEIKRAREYCTDGNSMKRRFLHNQLLELFRIWREEKQANKLQSYNDMIHAVHITLCDAESHLADAIRESYRYAIIDEFQDTNQLQWDIFSKIFEHAGHSIFVVGDPKQSIFSFQGADLHVYNAATKGNEKVASKMIARRLGTNYRSTNDMIDSCNHLFKTGFSIGFSDSGWPSNKCEPTFDDRPVSAFWLPSNESVDENEFARMAVAKIVESCEFVGDSTRLRVFDKVDTSTLRNVSFKDFVILARVRSEFGPIERELKKLGIPFVRYKDMNLFAGRECYEWIALFKALDVPDYSASNRRILSEALATDFFPEHPIDYKLTRHVIHGETFDDMPYQRPSSKLDSVLHPEFDDPLCTERKHLAGWRRLAQSYRWAELQESIYRDSEIESRLSSDLSKLQELTKLRQIGNYCIEYLYKKRCDIPALVRHLEILRNDSSGTEDQDGNLVEKGTELDAVQLMTIYASKGLEFPVVISVAGFKGDNPGVKGPFVYHENGKRYLGFEKEAKQQRTKEEHEEWQRLFYVAYTRASSVLMLPRYTKWIPKENNKNQKSKGNNKENEAPAVFAFLKNSIDQFAKDKKDSCWLSVPDDYEKYKSKVKEILQKKENNTKFNFEDNAEYNLFAQLDRIGALQKKIGKLSLMQHSYSSLASKSRGNHSNEPDVAREDGGNMYKNGDDLDDTDEIADNASHSVGDQPKDENSVCVSGDYIALALSESECGALAAAISGYPRGTLLGNAVHEVFEHVDFRAIGEVSDENLESEQELGALVQKCFEKYGVKYDDDIKQKTALIVWNTLRAKLPVIHGSKSVLNDYFALKDLEANEHLAEVEFLLRCESSKDTGASAEHLFKGFMDLIFVRKDDSGHERYSVLDWKTNVLEPESYASYDALKEVVDTEYKVQRILYSYCLIRWIKSFEKYKDMSDEDVFNHHFGGIYYAFVRGCKEGTSNGIYAHTWESYQALAADYKQVKGLVYFSKEGGEIND